MPDVNTCGPGGKWVIGRDSSSWTRLRLFCIPYAGAGASIYRQWESGLPATIQLCRIQLPGREERLRDRPFSVVHELIRVLAHELRGWLDLPFVLFGHSMGALIAFELVRELRRAGAPLPAHLFLSGRPAPHLGSRMPSIHHLPESEFKREMGRLNGTPAEVLEDRELIGLLMPMLRADFSMCETYRCLPEAPLPVPITAFGAVMDAHTFQEDLEAWRSYTHRTFKVRMFPGDHFYIHSMRSRLISAILEDLAAHLSGHAAPFHEVPRRARHDA